MAEKKDTNPKDPIGSKKVGLHVLSGQVAMMLSLAFLEGDCKYGGYNYRVGGARASVYYSAMMRHMMAWWEGEEIDPDSGLPHPIKAMACLTIIMDTMLNENLVDDRPPKVKNQNWVREYNKLADAIISKFPNPVPPYTEKGKNGK